MMPRGLKYTLILLPAVALIAAAVILEIHFQNVRPVQSCYEIRVSIEDVPDDSIPDPAIKDILDRIERADGIVIGKRLGEIDMAAIEAELTDESVFRKAQAWTTDDGILHVDLERRTPVLWLQDGNSGYYVDESGFAFQMPGVDSNSVHTISGPFTTNRELVREMIDWNDMAADCGLWSVVVDSICVANNGDISFSIESGETVLFGDNSNFKDKTLRLKKYISAISRLSDEGKKYRSVNLKYDRQIVCR